MRRRVLANLGFLLQIGGLILLLPILVGLFYGERESLIAISLGSVGFLVSGFLLNALCERKDLDFKTSCVLILMAFLIMPLVGSIPYVYLDPFESPNPWERLTNSIFESVSGFTTTGFSFILDSESLPRSFLLFRSMTELMGGVGVVFLLLVFFHSEFSLNSLGSALGIENVGVNLKKSYSRVLLVYSVYIVIFTFITFFLGVSDAVKAVSLVIDTLTGGFSPSADYLLQNLSPTLRLILLLLMLVGSLNFGFNFNLLTRKFGKLFTAEVKLYFCLIFGGTILVSVLSELNIFDSIFHVISMSSSTGFDYVGIPTLNETARGLFVLIMIIGGCGASMAGGIKVFRIIQSARSMKHNVVEMLRREGVDEEVSRMSSKERYESSSAKDSILLFLGTLFVLSLIFSTLGVPLDEAVFEVGSALTTNGISMGATNVAMPILYKYVLMAAMIIGRVEIMIVLVSLYSQRSLVRGLPRRVNASLRQFWKRNGQPTQDSAS